MQTKRKILTLLLVLQFLFSFSLFGENEDSGNRSNFLSRIFRPGKSYTNGNQSNLREQNLGEVIYFVLPDRFNNGNPYNDYGDYVAGQEDPDSDSQVMKHGLKKDNKAYYHGGDLEGVIEKLPYLKKMGITAIWITPNDSGVAARTMVFDLMADNPLTREIYIRGGLNGWGTDTPLTYRGNYTFQGQQYISAGDVEFKFADSDWSEYNFGAPFNGDGLTRGSNPGNLLTSFNLGTDSVYKINFFSYPDGPDGQSYSFFRFEKREGPLDQDIYLNLDGVDSAYRIAYVGDSLYEVDIPLTTGEHSFTIGDLFGAADTSDQWLTIDQTKSIVKNGSVDLKIWVNLEATYKVRLDVTDENDPKLTVITMMDYGPYGAMYLRGGTVTRD